jgi:hydrogenase-4 component B
MVVLGVGGALLHVWNHGLFKALLFFSAGAVVHALGTRELDELGGLGKRMPRTAAFFLFGAIAICGLPPLNGFVSELLIYLGLFRLMSIAPGHAWLAGALSAPALALIGALALACFVKAFGTAFSGHARSERVAHAHDGTSLMNVPMTILAAGCAAIGMAPLLFAPLLNRAVGVWCSPVAAASVSVQAVAPLGWISVGGALLVGLVWFASKGLRRLNDGGPVTAGLTWDCGYADPRPAMQYSSSSFAQMTTGLFAWALRPEMSRPSIGGPFPGPSAFQSHTPDLILDRLVLPACEFAVRILSWARWLQRGSIHAYILYIVATLIVLQFFR